MQTPAPEAPLAPASPDPSHTDIAKATAQPVAVPKTSAQIEQLITRRQELSSQLANVTERRRRVASDLTNTGEVAARTGLQQRLQVMDNRIIQLESDLAATSTAIASAPTALAGSSEAPGFRQPDNFEDGLVIGWLTSGLPLLIILFVMRRRWKRRSLPASAPIPAGDLRIERIESAIEAVAIEVERVSEGQRFVTKLLSEAPGQLRPVPANVEKEAAG